jgi:aspartokinase/homoserine dehydrogenase 1
MNEQPWTVHKFGGASLAGPAEYRQVADILQATTDRRQAAVVSASFGITDRLVALVDAAPRQPDAVEAGLADVREHHRALARELLAERGTADYEAALAEDLETIGAVLEAIRLLGRAPVEAHSLVTGFGEVWSARLLASYLAEQGRVGGWLHAGEVLTLRHSELGPVVLWDECSRRLAGRLPKPPDAIFVVTGYVARAEDGTPTTLGRNGSDFSASIFASLLEASEVVIWTNVNGVMSGDPRLIADAKVIHELSYHEAMELAYFGARVLHPRTMGPVVERGIPIFIRNSFRPEEAGTRISVAGGDGAGVKGITTIEGIALVNLEGAGMIGVPGTADRLFGALRVAGISVVMISQGSSEHSICFAVPESDADAAAEVAAAAFRLELEEGQIQGLEVTRECAIIAVVGDGMRGTPGVAAMMFGTLGHAGVNVRAIAQGASERNISAVIDAADATRALRAVHAGFYLSPQTLSVGVVGAGLVGGALIDQLAGEAPRLRREFNLDLRVRGITTSRRMVTDETRLDLAGWRDVLNGEGAEPADLDAFVDHLHAEHLPAAVLIDCTASQDVADRYADWLGRGIHVITPNKKGNTGPYAYYRRLRETRRAAGTRYLYETTVGAGLPIIHTLRDLKETGDVILAVEGVLSGTLAYLFNLFDGSVAFSQIVREAREKGYTEPDPRDDLSGMDVARKVVILGREMGLELELSDVEVESLVPAELAGGSVDDFFHGLPAYDDEISARQRAARESGQVLRYVGRLDAHGRASARLEQLPAEHAFAAIALTDNIVQFVTHRYRDNPLIVRGPGAGPAVTAAGVFSDLLRLSSYLGANL